MKKLAWRIIFLIFVSTNLLINIVPVYAAVVPPLEAKGVVLMDGTTGDVLYSKNPNTQFEPASTTKIMTALVTLEKTNLDDKVTIGINPPLVDGTIMCLSSGEVYTVRELLLGLLLESGNDAAEALAEYISGSNADFGVLMTKKAKEIGAINTTFKNPSGLHEEGHLTTAYDLALIMKAAYSIPEFNEIARTKYHFYENNPNYDGSEKWVNNKNHVINPDTPYYYEYAYSGKVGYTPEAYHTYAASAVKGNQVLIASFLNAENKDAQFLSVGPLFDYGFENFETVKLISKGDKISEYIINNETIIPLLSSKDFYYSKSKSDSIPAITFSYEPKDFSKESISKGQSLFTGNILLDDKIYGELEFISSINKEYTFNVAVNQSVYNIKENILFKIFLISIILISLLLLFAIINKAKRRRKSNLSRKIKRFRNRKACKKY